MVQARQHLIDKQNKHEFTPLHLAVYYGKKSIVDILISVGAKMDIIQRNGMTPLQMAIVDKRESIAWTMKACGADTSSHHTFSEGQNQLLREPMSEEEILEIRFRVYFGNSLFSQLRFLL